MVARNAKRSISTILRKNRGLWTVYILSDSFLANCCCSLFFYFHWPKWLQCGGYHEKCEHAGVFAGLRAGSDRFVNRLKFERTLSLVLIYRRCTCDMAWDTVPIWEHKWPATLVILVFIAGMPAKLIRVQLRRHAGGKVLRWVLRCMLSFAREAVQAVPATTSRYTSSIWEPSFTCPHHRQPASTCNLGVNNTFYSFQKTIATDLQEVQRS